ncbi:alpha/beta hydrolase [Pseudoflavitalea sp. G-6-1-2]|uniref:alpha/beta hydrolase n=1 Tax=Pseudoflavitalea sp. G-6-1-2 TaxID=2728841 RepID=UPI001469F653|nr:alpha/beta hydrolase [Pseudoflavitalea sp. G-6-1-2]NML23526.1 alpha/beta hydrolase [Pseudoflavitalea sp. G-6-1-2]
MSVLKKFRTGFVTVSDGTTIGYRIIGNGPALILLHGGLQSSLNFTTLATLLSTDFTVYVPDRRGRGLSSPYQEKDNLLTEAEDLLTLINTIDAKQIFALSSGAIITLQAALMGQSLQKIALYEPPIQVDNKLLRKADIELLKKTQVDYTNAMRTGNAGKAFVTILKGTGDPGDKSLFTILPAFIISPLLNFMIKKQEKKKDETELPLAELVPTFRYDSRVVSESLPLIEKSRTIKAEVLLLGGTRSHHYLSVALDCLERSIPHVKRIQFEKLGHCAADNSGSPMIVAETLRKFFLGKGSANEPANRTKL